MPDAAGSWPEEGTQYLPGAPMEPVQQPYQQQYQQQPYPQQGYAEQQQAYGDQQQYAAQQQYGVPQQQYPAQPYQEQTAPQQPMFAEEEQAAVPSEFDHLFRDSSPQNRRSISGQAPVVSGPGAAAPPGFQQQQAAAQQQAAQATAVYNPAQAPQGFEDRSAGEYMANQPFGGGYGPGGGSGGGPGAGNRRTPLIIGGVVVVVAAIGLYFGLSGGGSGSGATPGATASATATHASTETAQQQANRIDQLVQESRKLRGDINDEVGDLDGCRNVGALQSEISATAAARQNQASQVSSLDVSKIPHGAALASYLNSAWSASATADSDYAKAAADVAGSCSKGAVKNDSNYIAAGQAGDSATSDKDNAAQLWNQVMVNYGEPSVTAGEL